MHCWHTEADLGPRTGGTTNYERGAMHRISLVVATKDRPDDLRRLLNSLSLQTTVPDEIVIVDASVEANESVESILNEFLNLTIRYLPHWPPSASAQRNKGILACHSAATLIGFADDDTTFEPEAFTNMLTFWNSACADVLGTAFNLYNYPKRHKSVFKHSKLAEWISLYSLRPGKVSLSGWQSMIGRVSATEFVDWLPSSAVLFRRDVFDRNRFDEAFNSYSYLEDLDLSYTLSRVGRLAVVVDAGFHHFPSQHGRISTRDFGRCEVRNRLYLVRKHSLSLTRCYVGLGIRLAMSIIDGLAHGNSGQLTRAFGNIEELMKQGFVTAKRAVAGASLL